MKIAKIIARVILGLIFFVFGLNGFLHFLEVPPMQGDAAEFMRILYESGWLKVIKLLEIVGGLMLLLGRFVPLGLIILGPIVVNIFLFHALLAPEGMVIALVVLILEIFLIWVHRGTFAKALQAK